MGPNGTDLAFPDCCACCPHLRTETAGCSHDLRQSLVKELSTDQSCPVYAREKTEAMRKLSRRW